MMSGSLKTITAAAGLLFAGERADAQFAPESQGKTPLPVSTKTPPPPRVESFGEDPFGLGISRTFFDAFCGGVIGGIVVGSTVCVVTARTLWKSQGRATIDHLRTEVNQVCNEIERFQGEMKDRHTKAQTALETIKELVKEKSISDASLDKMMEVWAQRFSFVDNDLLLINTAFWPHITQRKAELAHANPLNMDSTAKTIKENLRWLRCEMMPGNPLNLSSPTMCQRFNTDLSFCLQKQNEVVGFLMAKGHDDVVRVLREKVK